MSDKEIPKAYEHQGTEDTIYQQWEKSGAFAPKAETEGETTFTISIPPPNATGKLHIGHAMMLAVEDLMTRYHRLKGDATLWLPGQDHAAIATQNVVERKIWEEKGEDRHQIGRDELLRRIDEFVENTRDTIRQQFRKMGSSLDWKRERYTLDEGLSRAVRMVFRDMYNDGLIYRGNRVVNWCTRCQSTLADDEVNHTEVDATLYTFKYDANFPISISTTRPETKVGDTAVAVNPSDERYQKFIGQTFTTDFAGTKLNIQIVGSESVEKEFGTGALGVTPAHSMIDAEIATKHNLSSINVIGQDGKMTNEAGDISGLSVNEARQKIVAWLGENNLLEKEEDVKQNLSVCYRCNTPIEPLISKQWFVAVDKKFKLRKNTLDDFFKAGEMVSLKELMLASVHFSNELHTVQETNLRNSIEDNIINRFKRSDIEAVPTKINLIPDRFSKIYFSWINNLHDWCISRQIWFGHRIPVWYCIKCNKDQFANFRFDAETYNKNGGFGFVQHFNDTGEKWMDATDIRAQIESGFMTIPDNCAPIVSIDQTICPKCNSDSDLVQDPDTLDTWFSSGLWTFSTLLDQNIKVDTLEEWRAQSPDLKRFHPTSVLETGYDILFFWVARMILMTTYAMGEVPFRTVYLHGLVRDEQGRKMSKSLNNGIDPLDVIAEYGADPVRLSLLIGVTPGNDARLSAAKIGGYRNFVNKLWNISRYILMTTTATNEEPTPTTLSDRWILAEFDELKRRVTDHIENYRFSPAGEELYEFTWSKLADWYVEIAKIEGNKDAVLRHILRELLVLWHPFTPYVTEHIWSLFNDDMLITQHWPHTYEASATPIDHANFSRIEYIVTAARDIKQQLGTLEKINVTIYSPDYAQIIKEQLHIIDGLAKVKSSLGEAPSDNATKRVLAGVTIYTDATASADTLARQAKERAELEKYIHSLSAKLANAEFKQNAPAQVVAAEETKLKEAQDKLEQLN